jgi:2-polyprenyl-3-methyl-5-hydroxy-6-metoxy-1,4-benzoquinol methylase
MFFRKARSSDPRSFDELAQIYERRDELTRGWVTDWLTELLSEKHGGAAMDLGCGNGRTALLLAEYFEEVRAIDLSSEMIRIARSRRSHPRVTYEIADIDQVTGQYDFVTSIMALHHVPDLPRTLARIAELVTPGGTAVLVDPAEEPRTRWQFHFGHLVSLLVELRAGDEDAWQRFRLKSDRRWMDHLMSDRFLTVDQFYDVYHRALPGAVISPVSGLFAVVWERPPSRNRLTG